MEEVRGGQSGFEAATLGRRHPSVMPHLLVDGELAHPDPEFVAGELSAAPPVPHQSRVDLAGERAGEDHAHPTLPVARVGEGLVEPTDREVPGAPHGGAQDVIPFEDRAPLVDHRERLAGSRGSPHLPSVTDDGGIGAKDVEVGSGACQGPQRLETPRFVAVVAVEDRHEFAAGGPHGGVLRRRFSAVVLVQDDDLVAKGRQRTSKIVGRTVVADHDLGRGHRLFQSGSDRVADERRHVVGRDDDRERRRLAGGRDRRVPGRRDEESPRDRVGGQVVTCFVTRTHTMTGTRGSWSSRRDAETSSAARPIRKALAASTFP